MAKKSEATRIYEAQFQFCGFDEAILVPMNEKEWERIVSVFESESLEGRFYGTDFAAGYEVYVNPKHVSKINLLEDLPGVEFPDKESLSAEEWEERREKRRQSGVDYIFRIWSTDGKIETYEEISFDSCEGVRPLDDIFSAFIGFMDEDGERVMLNVEHIVAWEIFDPYILSSEELSKLMSLNGKNSDTTEP